MTTVTATITDTGGQSWNGGAWFATLVTKPGFVNPNNGYLVGGVLVPNQGGIGGALDGSGAFSTSLTANDTIGPAGSVWRFQVVSQASSTSFVTEVAITGTSQDISAQLTPPAIRVNMQVPALAYIAYTDAEVFNANIGQIYWNVTSQKMRVCTVAPSTWADLGGTSGAITGTIAATQVAVGTGANTIGGSSSLVWTSIGGLVANNIDSATNVAANGALLSAAINGDPGVRVQGNTPATNVLNISSGTLEVIGEYWNGAASTNDTWALKEVLGTGTNPTSTLAITHAGSSGAASATLQGHTIPVIIAQGAQALHTDPIASGAKSVLIAISATGTLTTDNIMLDFNADPSGTTGYSPSASGMLTIVKYPTADTVNIYVYNNTGGSVTPGAVTVNWRVLR